MFCMVLFADAVKGFLGIGLPTTAMALLTVSIIGTNGTQYTRCVSPHYIAKKYWLFGIFIIISIFLLH